MSGCCASWRSPGTCRRSRRPWEFRGRYHVLGGAISPLDGVGPDQLHVKELLARLGEEEISEVRAGDNPNIEGEATASYLARMLKTMDVGVSRIASGLPVGGDLEYADEVTLGRAHRPAPRERAPLDKGRAGRPAYTARSRGAGRCRQRPRAPLVWWRAFAGRRAV